jgi:very-short-patch-repair endonuclease
MAAVLATDGVLSHRAAAALWGIFASTYLEVVAPSIRRRPGIHVHRSVLRADEVTIERGIRVTGVWRTVLDLASVVRVRTVERAFNEAEVQGLTDRVSLAELIDRHPHHPGRAVASGILRTGAAVTRSELEALFLDSIADRELPAPEVNVQLLVAGEWLECDCVWRRHRLIVELDGRAFHTTAAAFERDRARDRRLQAAGWTVVRVTWRQLRVELERLIADLRSLLDRDLSGAGVL